MIRFFGYETHIKQAIDQVYNVYDGTKESEEALDEAAAKSAKVLGWYLPFSTNSRVIYRRFS